jgi:hypothetical protein
MKNALLSVVVFLIIFISGRLLIPMLTENSIFLIDVDIADCTLFYIVIWNLFDINDLKKKIK